LNPVQFILGIDIGTTNTKAIAYTIGGEIRETSSVSYSPVIPEQGWHELDPGILFRAALNAAADVLRKMKDTGRLMAVGFSSAMHGLIAVNEEGVALTNMITWADLRASSYAKKLRASDEGVLIHNKTGTPVHSMSPLCKLLWLKEHKAGIFNAAAKFVSIKEYLLYHLFGKWVIDYSIASATGLFDIHQKKWFDPSLRLAGIQANNLSEPVPTDFILKGLKKEYATELGIEGDIPFVIGASDGCLANAGSGAVETGDVSLTIGTSGAVRMVTRKPMEDRLQRLFNYILTDDLFVSGGPINNGAFLLKWYSENFLDRPFLDSADFQWFTQQASGVPAGAEGLVFLPYIQGERAPVWDSDAKGVFFGVHSSHTRVHFMRAIIEGICFALKEVMDSLEEVIAPVENVYASGGFIQSPEWVQILADILGKPVIINDKADASAIGAAMLSMYALGIIPGFPPPLPQNERANIVNPRTDDQSKYARNYAVYRELYGKLKTEFPRL
jgi:gluconokinase